MWRWHHGIRRYYQNNNIWICNVNLFSGVFDELGFATSITTVNDDDEDFDFFSSSGGMEMEENSKLYFTQQNPVISKGLNNTDQIQISSYFSIPCEHPTFHHQSLPSRHEGFYNMLNPYIPQMEHMLRGSPYINTFHNHHHHLTPSFGHILLHMFIIITTCGRNRNRITTILYAWIL